MSSIPFGSQCNERFATEKIRPPGLLLSQYRVQLIQIVYLPGSWGGKSNRHSHRTEPIAPRDDCACGASRKPKRSVVTKWRCWKSGAKETKAVIGSPSECQKQRDFQGGMLIPPKGGVAGGVKNAKSSGKTWFKVVKPGPFRAHFGPNRASLGAFEFILIESVLESGPKRPHPTASEHSLLLCLLPTSGNQPISRDGREAAAWRCSKWKVWKRFTAAAKS